MKSGLQFLLVNSLVLFILGGCAQSVNTTVSAPTDVKEPVRALLPQEKPQPSASPVSIATVLKVITSENLQLQVGEELMLVGDVEMSDKRKLSFDQIQKQLKIENLKPDVLSLDIGQRLIKALKPGLAEVRISPLNQEKLGLTVKVLIVAPPPAIDPQVALVELEIE
ncbi:hypothetical protein COW36_22385 [bacterium (Candidatus Blackallbacteria) CG17_big_fil_post_rev_8_21_14_2_50_48_46]|uniref:AMIN domain-containing protein n=1 Tax=bacterium (Candidatus Blackallbacteria) CG17_big_fil_post_rev_8_21_14_2_50_48_46 TaxID=2014261 RepID=A0A2M7FYH8_9BACT|nr:MAG: hypothetical protein COW64_13815 [bacterium (Candidatus Blackallbacteria) CG18_big_fil_WC_8_21_14_2_50_49_26]PIW14361.1 MAG: hypothetical protein COW36_22385 [bacterium (Candidatus Blackallbacteria) CG17_big_fil_post_rev_8_21_14_2_50_48_46]PIW45630.1 MAG: hypothetical protein COW20_19990 [bacterium (Candidatus Blackallbacteria) CG13_big_fil_rev_8_21_14_2_50_49_14]